MTTTTFSYTGALQTFTVPTGVTSIDFDIQGAAGGPSLNSANNGGSGGRVVCTLAVTAGGTLNIYVGGVGDHIAFGGGTGPNAFNGGGGGGGYQNGTYGGGGGGASDVRIGGTALSDRKIVAGGGGGAGTNQVGGGGGGTTGVAGTGSGSAGGGGGGTSAAGGAGGGGAGANGGAGSSGVGGNGNGVNGSYGGGGGGGGGYYGGGAGAGSYTTTQGGSGGGGSSYTDAAATSITHTQGYRAGDGQVILTYTAAGSDGTASPTAVARVAVVPASGFNATASPAVVARAGVVPASTVGGGASPTPAAVARTVVASSSTTSGNTAGVAHPSTVARTVVRPAPTASGTVGVSGLAHPAAVGLYSYPETPTVSGTFQTNEMTTITVPAGAVGTVTITVNGVTSAPISVTASAATVQAALEALSNIAPGDVAVTGGPLGTSAVDVTWIGSLALTPMTVLVSQPSGSGVAVVAVAAPPYIPVGRVRLYDRHGTTLVAYLDGAFDVEWQEVDNGPGVGRFSVALSDTDSALVQLGQVVYCDLYDRGSVFSWRVEAYPQMRIQGAEELGQVMKVSGRGSASILETALCYPYGGVDAVPVRSVRSFSFASQDYIEDAAWVPAVEIAEQGDMTTYWTVFLPGATTLSPAPGGWPLMPTIPWWIWSQTYNFRTGMSYFRETFTTAGEANVSILATADNFYTIYFDGVAVLGDSENAEAWNEHRAYDIVLPAGSHTIAAVVENLETGQLASTNPGGLLVAIIVPHDNAEGEPTMVLTSNASWTALPYPASEPGWTPGAIILKLINEAQARGLLGDVSYEFTEMLDSSGAAWETIPEFGVNLGADLLSTLGQLVTDGWIDWAMSPFGWALRMWKRGNRGSLSNVLLEDGVNLVEATYEPARPIFNRLLVAYNAGLFTVGDAVGAALASQATYGVIEGFLTVDAAKPAEAMRLALKSLEEAMDDELAVTYQVEPSAFELLRSGGWAPSKPYVSYGVGDGLQGPNEIGSTRVYGIIGITITIDDMGDPLINLEINRRKTNVDEVRVKLLQTLGSSVVGTAPGSRATVFENSGPFFPTRVGTAGSIVAGHIPTPGEVTFTYPGNVNTLGTSPRWVTPYQINIYEVVMAATVAGSANISVSILGDTFTLPAGETDIIIPTETHRFGSNSFTISLTDYGNGDVEGLTVTIRYRYYTGTV